MLILFVYFVVYLSNTQVNVSTMMLNVKVLLTDGIPYPPLPATPQHTLVFRPKSVVSITSTSPLDLVEINLSNNKGSIHFLKHKSYFYFKFCLFHNKLLTSFNIKYTVHQYTNMNFKRTIVSF